MMGRKPLNNFEERLRSVNDRYTLISKYVNQKTLVVIKDHLGIEYRSMPNDLLKGTNPLLSSAINPSMAFEIKSKIIHGNRYIYDMVDYKNSRYPVSIICKIHGVFNQKPVDHLRKSGCPICGLNNTINNLKTNHIGWSLNKWKKVGETKNGNPSLYIIKIYDEKECFIKIGRTYNGINKRFKNNSWNLPYNFEVIKIIQGSYEDIFLKEKELIKLYKENKYFPIKDFRGKTECFNINILNNFL